MAIILDFEKPIIELENKIEELKKFTSDESIDLSDEIIKLTRRLEKLKAEIFGKLTSWQRVQLARHPERHLRLRHLPFQQPEEARSVGHVAEVVPVPPGIDEDLR